MSFLLAINSSTECARPGGMPCCWTPTKGVWKAKPAAVRGGLFSEHAKRYRTWCWHLLYPAAFHAYMSVLLHSQSVPRYWQKIINLQFPLELKTGWGAFLQVRTSREQTKCSILPNVSGAKLPRCLWPAALLGLRHRFGEACFFFSARPWAVDSLRIQASGLHSLPARNSFSLKKWGVVFCSLS